METIKQASINPKESIPPTLLNKEAQKTDLSEYADIMTFALQKASKLVDLEEGKRAELIEILMNKKAIIEGQREYFNTMKSGGGNNMDKVWTNILKRVGMSQILDTKKESGDLTSGEAMTKHIERANSKQKWFLHQLSQPGVDLKQAYASLKHDIETTILNVEAIDDSYKQPYKTVLEACGKYIKNN